MDTPASGTHSREAATANSPALPALGKVKNVVKYRRHDWVITAPRWGEWRM